MMTFFLMNISKNKTSLHRIRKRLAEEMKTSFDKLNRLVSDWLYKNNLKTFQSKFSPPGSLFINITKVCQESILTCFPCFNLNLRRCSSGSSAFLLLYIILLNMKSNVDWYFLFVLIIQIDLVKIWNLKRPRVKLNESFYKIKLKNNLNYKI